MTRAINRLPASGSANSGIKSKLVDLTLFIEKTIRLCPASPRLLMISSHLSAIQQSNKQEVINSTAFWDNHINFKNYMTFEFFFLKKAETISTWGNFTYSSVRWTTSSIMRKTAALVIFSVINMTVTSIVVSFIRSL